MAATGAKIVASTSKSDLAVHEVMIKNAAIIPIAIVSGHLVVEHRLYMENVRCIRFHRMNLGRE